MQVYQRQLLKADLASATIEAGGGGARGLSQAELKQLFRLQVRAKRGRDGRPAGRAPWGAGAARWRSQQERVLGCCSLPWCAQCPSA